MASFGAGAVLFGGNTALDHFGDTWRWNGDAWAKASDTGPTIRSDTAMAELGGKVVLFGGYSGEHLGDTWTCGETRETPTETPTDGTSKGHGRAQVPAGGAA